MAKRKKHNIIIVDDSRPLCIGLSKMFSEAGYTTRYFTSVSEFKKSDDRHKCHLVITDVKMPKLDGWHLLEDVKRNTPWIPVIMFSGFFDTKIAVQAIKMGAADFLEKPVDHAEMLEKVHSLVSNDDLDCEDLEKGPLTEMEKKVLRMVLTGKSNKEIAFIMKRSSRTIEMHRRNFMYKFGVDNIVDLVKKAIHWDMENGFD